MNKTAAFEPADLAAIVVRARSTDLAASHEAFNEIVVALQDVALGSACSYLHDVQLAEDAAQESFLTAWRELHSLRDPQSFVAWFKRILATQCHRVLRRKPIEGVDACDVAGENWEDRVNRRDRAKLVREALGHLPPAERSAIILFYYCGRSHAAIAKFLGVPRTTVVKRLYAARRRLGSALAPLRSAIERTRPSRNRQFASMVRDGMYDDYIGVYRFDRRPELTVRVKRVGNHLVGLAAGQRNRIVLGSKLSELRAVEFDGRAQFVRNRSGRITHFVYYEFGQRMGVASKIATRLP